MRHLKTVTVPSKTETRVDYVTCDLCGMKGSAGYPGSEWGRDGYEVAETVVQVRTGSAYPEGGSSETTAFDICVGCFKGELVPWLTEQGARPATTETN